MLPRILEKSANKGINDISKAYIREFSKIPVLPVDEFNTLFEKFKAGDQAARDLLIKSNLRFVIWVVVRTKAYYTHIATDDMISEGNLGLLSALEKFDPTRGVAFTSFAVWHIRKAIHNAIDNQEPIVKRHTDSLYRGRYKKAYAELTQKLNDIPSLEDIAGELNVKVSALEGLHYGSDAKLINDDDFFHNLEDESFTNSSAQDDYRDTVETLLTKVDPLHAEMIRALFGIGCDAMTTENVAKKFKMTKGNVIRVKGKVLRQLNKASQSLLV